MDIAVPSRFPASHKALPPPSAPVPGSRTLTHRPHKTATPGPGPDLSAACPFPCVADLTGFWEEGSRRAQVTLLRKQLTGSNSERPSHTFERERSFSTFGSLEEGLEVREEGRDCGE